MEPKGLDMVQLKMPMAMMRTTSMTKSIPTLHTSPFEATTTKSGTSSLGTTALMNR